MRQVIIIEEDPSPLQLLQETLSAIDPSLNIFHYSGINEFYTAFKDSLEQSQSESSEEGSDDNSTPMLHPGLIHLIVADLETTKALEPQLWGKIFALLKTHSPPQEIEEEYEARLVLTAFESADQTLDLSHYIGTTVFNVITKPFDQFLLKQFLQIALQSIGPLATDEVYAQEGEAVVEMIKDIEIDRLTELGFRTKSKREIPQGKVARYYGAPLEGPENKSVFAYCYASRPHKETPGAYSCSFSYFGIPTEQLSLIRRSITLSKEKKDLPFETTESQESPPPTALILCRDPQTTQTLQGMIEEKLTGLSFTHFLVLADLMQLVPTDQQESSNTPSSSSFLGSSNEVSLVFDEAMDSILSACETTEEGPQELKKVFALETKSLGEKSKVIEDFLRDKDKILFERVLNEKNLPKKMTLKLHISEESSTYIELLSLEKTEDHENKTTYTLTLRELSKEEIFNHIKKQVGEISKIKFVFFDSHFSPSLSAVKQVIATIHGDQVVNTKYFKMTDSPLTKYSDLEESLNFDDLFTTPFDLFYLTRKMKMHAPDIFFKNPEDNSRQWIPLEEGIKTALPVKIKSLSEVHLSLHYERPIRIGDIRNFVLWIPRAKSIPEILGICQYSEKVDGGKYQCDFLFFGVRERELKYIRRWIKEVYINEKKGSS